MFNTDSAASITDICCLFPSVDKASIKFGTLKRFFSVTLFMCNRSPNTRLVETITKKKHKETDLHILTGNSPHITLYIEVNHWKSQFLNWVLNWAVLLTDQMDLTSVVEVIPQWYKIAQEIMSIYERYAQQTIVSARLEWKTAIGDKLSICVLFCNGLKQVIVPIYFQ